MDKLTTGPQRHPYNTAIICLSCDPCVKQQKSGDFVIPHVTPVITGLMGPQDFSYYRKCIRTTW